MPNQLLLHSPLPLDKSEPQALLTTRPELPFHGKLVVNADLPVGIVHGLFAKPGTHEVLVSFTPTTSALPKTSNMTISAAGNNPLHFVSAQRGPSNHSMDEEYRSTISLRLDKRFVSVALVPSSPGLLALKNHPFSPDTPNALREATIAYFQYNPAEFDLRIQLHGDTRPRTIARLVIPAQNEDDSAMGGTVENLSTACTLSNIKRPSLAVYKNHKAGSKSTPLTAA